jgi:hypothetical protein
MTDWPTNQPTNQPCQTAQRDWPFSTTKLAYPLDWCNLIRSDLHYQSNLTWSARGGPSCDAGLLAACHSFDPDGRLAAGDWRLATGDGRQLNLHLPRPLAFWVILIVPTRQEVISPSRIGIIIR